MVDLTHNFERKLESVNTSQAFVMPHFARTMKVVNTASTGRQKSVALRTTYPYKERRLRPIDADAKLRTPPIQC
jgi:hypothetical protein